MIGSLLLQAGTGGANYTQFVMLAGMVAIFYFFFIRPQQKKQKDQKKFVEAIRKGDKVVTMGGIHGKISGIDGDLVILDVDKGNKLTVDKSSISMEASKKVSG